MTIRTFVAQTAALAASCIFVVSPLPSSAAIATTNAMEPPLPYQPCTAFRIPALPNAHSHNDYNHRWPLCDALRNGHTSVEVDIWYVKNIAQEESLQIGHSYPSGRMLDELYLARLRKVIRHNKKTYNSRSVLPFYPGRFQLLIDIKSTGREGRRAFELLHQMLRDRYRSMVTRWHNGQKITGVVDVVVTGTRPRNPVIDEWRFIGLDADITQLNSPHEPGRCKRFPLVSAPWIESYNDPGVLQRLVRLASVRGQYLRVFHTSSDNWQKLYDAGVHYIDSSSHPAYLGYFLKDKPAVAPPPAVHPVTAIGHALGGVR